MLNCQRACASALFVIVAGCLAAEPVRAGADVQPAFKIVSEDSRDAGVALSVRLEARLTDAELKSLADGLRLRRPAGKPQVTALNVYLKGMDLDAAPWAEVRFAPDARVTVKGLRRDEEDAYRAQATADLRTIVGVWLTSPPALPGMLLIYRDKERRQYAEWSLRNGQKTVDEVYESIGGRGRRYDIAGSGGGYYLALWNGALQLGDKGSIIAVAERLTFEKKPVAIAAPVTASGTGPIAVEPGAPPLPSPSKPVLVKKSKPAPKNQHTVSDALATAIRAY
ncbi:MAG: hypothetical protein ACKVP4_01965 [Hyphomicrobium sp.]